MKVCIIKIDDEITQIDKRANLIDRKINNIDKCDLYIIPRIRLSGSEKLKEYNYRLLRDLSVKYESVFGNLFTEKNNEVLFNSFMFVDKENILGVVRSRVIKDNKIYKNFISINNQNVYFNLENEEINNCKFIIQYNNDNLKEIASKYKVPVIYYDTNKYKISVFDDDEEIIINNEYIFEV